MVKTIIIIDDTENKVDPVSIQVLKFTGPVTDTPRAQTPAEQVSDAIELALQHAIGGGTIALMNTNVQH
jgi:hypothetical protein